VQWLLTVQWPDEIWTADFYDALIQTCYQVSEKETAKLAWHSLNLASVPDYDESDLADLTAIITSA
jgi:hypothetical protein